MRLRFFLVAVLGVAACAVRAQTDEITVTAEPPAAPGKGMSSASVVSVYGEPTEKRAPVGGGSAQQPPITRWNYDGFTVVFEHGHVIDSVLKGRPAPIRVREGLSDGTP